MKRLEFKLIDGSTIIHDIENDEHADIWLKEQSCGGGGNIECRDCQFCSHNNHGILCEENKKFSISDLRSVQLAQPEEIQTRKKELAPNNFNLLIKNVNNEQIDKLTELIETFK